MSQPLREPLEHLHTELYKANSHEAHETLTALQQDTKKTLGHPNPHVIVAADPNYRTRLEATIERFEASHPELTRAVRNVLEVFTANGL